MSGLGRKMACRSVDPSPMLACGRLVPQFRGGCRPEADIASGSARSGCGFALIESRSTWQGAMQSKWEDKWYKPSILRS